MMKWSIIIVFVLFLHTFLNAQLLKGGKPNRADILMGALRPQRTCYDVKSYYLDVRFDIINHRIVGTNTMKFVVVENTKEIQVDLYENMQMDAVFFHNKQLPFRREYNAVFIDFPTELTKSKDTLALRMKFSGEPHVATNPPWQGGFVYSTDNNGIDWVAVAVQGDGASLWFPCKDHPADEVENVYFRMQIPDNLIGVSNGKLIQEEPLENNYKAYTWQVTYPINSYNITFYIGDYVHFNEPNNAYSIDYYVLEDHLEAAKEQFQQVKPMLQCFEEKFGPYPFARDGYKLVEAPYLGMEHQSAVAYGNKFMNGYLGTDLSGTGIGLKWDFIIIHESGHEWFGNSISTADIADMWIHESFTSYSEAVFVECQYGKEEALDYIVGIRAEIENDAPMQGVYGTNREGSGDMYYKGSNMWNTIRFIVNDDELWWEAIRSFVKQFSYQTINKEQVINFFNTFLKRDLTSVFNQYITRIDVPVLKYKVKKHNLYLKWDKVVKGFEMPVIFKANNREFRIESITRRWKDTKVEVTDMMKVIFNQKYFYYNL
ncbi:MAG: M1 family metallopeptidase [Brumimicrobium sp.]|nr:M1 family metallopeptidase [Brumimicrobium sp.]